MKSIVIRGALVALLCMGGIAPVLADSGRAIQALCYPKPSPEVLSVSGFDGPGQVPLCYPAEPKCGPIATFSGPGQPPLCYPGAPCKQSRSETVLSGPGDPPLCYPGEPNCPQNVPNLPFNGPGQPPLCYPGEPACPNN